MLKPAEQTNRLELPDFAIAGNDSEDFHLAICFAVKDQVSPNQRRSNALAEMGLLITDGRVLGN